MPKPNKKSSGLKLGSKMKFDKTLLLVIIGVTVAVFGFLIYQRSQAATTPLDVSFGQRQDATITTTDGITAKGSCNKSLLKSAYGNVVRCVQERTVSGKYQLRNVVYNMSAKAYIADGNWVQGSAVALPVTLTAPYKTCSNTGNSFAFIRGIKTSAYGTAYSGVEFRRTWIDLYKSKLQARFASMNNNVCGSNSSMGWMDVLDTTN